MKKLPLIFALTMYSAIALSQSLQSIFDNTAKQIAETKALVTLPKNTWLENIEKGNDGNLYVTNYPEGKILQVTLSGKSSDYAKVNGKIAGIAKFKQNEFLVVGWDSIGRPSVFLVGANRKTSLFTPINGGMFPNGIISIGHNLYLITDSYAGCIWLLDAAKKKTEVWLKDDLLARSSDKTKSPAANGLKIYQGNLYVSNSEKHLLLKIPFANNKPGKPEIFISNVFVDDFQFDSRGNIYAAANLYNYVIKITQSKVVTIIAGIEQGAAGPTAVLVIKNKMGKDILYVPTCGGMGVPPPTGIEEGKILMVSPE